MKRVTIYGERCSGTTYLEELIKLNFDVEITWNYGWKHFFGFNDLTNSEDVLFIGIIRNLEDWINSLYREKHHLTKNLTQNFDTFLTNEFYSITPDGSGSEMLNDRNIETNERYKNIFELRLVKNKFLINKMPKLVKNYCLITYDDLIYNFKNTMDKLTNSGLTIKNNINYPLNTINYKQNKDIIFKKKNNEIPKEKIKNLIKDNKELLLYEHFLFNTIL